MPKSRRMTMDIVSLEADAVRKSGTQDVKD